MIAKRLSPIEMMVDQATGFKPSAKLSRPMVTLRCPLCKRTKQVDQHYTDPSGTAVVEAPCHDCDHGGLKPETRYYDVDGRWWNGATFIAHGHRQ